jgi:hypothetical protein
MTQDVGNLIALNKNLCRGSRYDRKDLSRYHEEQVVGLKLLKQVSTEGDGLVVRDTLDVVLEIVGLVPCQGNGIVDTIDAEDVLGDQVVRVVVDDSVTADTLE